MHLALNGINVTVPDAEVSRILLERLQAPAVAASASSSVTPPRVGEYWPGQGGVFVGIKRDEAGGRDYYLIDGRDLDDASHDEQLAAAKAATDEGFTDWDLPTRKEQRLQFANVADKYQQASYWSKEQHASRSNDAWDQNFGNGDQSNWSKSSKLRARLVRRLSI